MNKQKDDILKSIFISLIVHTICIILYSLKISFFPDESLLYESAIRVDLVALPDKLASLPAPPIEAPTVESLVKETSKVDIKIKEPLVDLDKTKNKNIESAIDKLRKDVAIDKVKGLLNKEKKEDVKIQPTIYKGNILSPGTELTGVNRLDHQDYHAMLDRHVKQYWSLPEWVAKVKLKTQVRIYLNENGLLVDSKVVKGSGQESYDESVLDSVKKASPYPAPPVKFRDVVRVDGILLGFPE